MNYKDDFIRYLSVERNYSLYTISNYKKDIDEFINYHQNILNINENIVKKYLIYLYNCNLSKSTISRKLSSLRSFYNYLVKENIVNDNYFKEITNPKQEKKLPIYLTNEKIEDMLKIPFSDDLIGKRNKLIIELLYATGVRVGELVNIKLKNIDFNNRMIKIMGKGSKERIVIYNKHTKEALEEYLKYISNIDSEYLIISKSGKHLTERMIWNIVNKITRLAHIDTHISPHKLRHSFATEMLNNGVDLVSVKELLGHESLSTTSIYTHLTNKEIRKVYENAHPRARR